MWPASLNLTWNVSCTTVYLIKNKNKKTKWCLTINNILHQRGWKWQCLLLRSCRMSTGQGPVFLAFVFRWGRRLPAVFADCLKAVRASSLWERHSLTSQIWTFNLPCLSYCCTHTLTSHRISTSTVQHGILQPHIASWSSTVASMNMKLYSVSLNVHLNGHGRLVATILN